MTMLDALISYVQNVKKYEDFDDDDKLFFIEEIDKLVKNIGEYYKAVCATNLRKASDYNSVKDYQYAMMRFDTNRKMMHDAIIRSLCILDRNAKYFITPKIYGYFTREELEDSSKACNLVTREKVANFILDEFKTLTEEYAAEDYSTIQKVNLFKSIIDYCK